VQEVVHADRAGVVVRARVVRGARATSPSRRSPREHRQPPIRGGAAWATFTALNGASGEDVDEREERAARAAIVRRVKLDGRRLTASRGLAVDLRLQWFETPWTHGEGLTRGYRVVDDTGGRWSDRDLDDAGVHVLRVAGVAHRAAELQADGFAPGEPVILVPEPDNPHDVFALAVRDLGLGRQAGYVPATRSRELVEEMRFRPLHAVALAEHRAGGERVGLRVAASFAPLLSG